MLPTYTIKPPLLVAARYVHEAVSQGTVTAYLHQSLKKKKKININIGVL